ncbi:hypothetical protein JM84_2733 [Dokdonia sp. Hel_I_63]|uniref:hypothetical protein n=1 Tax=Dokdonia sp. Hel_I_63 TaxID=1249996 RepID=UPI00119C8B94|nr:hypothetical protein [Dokdonia sp. Hel_I_63]TVZ23779.1 hypothetical protein JM84_2733 [Dokdonia sp. Hel_I_63]
MNKKGLKKLRKKGKVIKRKRPLKEDVLKNVEQLSIGKQLSKLFLVLSFSDHEIKDILRTKPQISATSILTPELYVLIKPIIEININNYLASMPKEKYVTRKKRKKSTLSSNNLSNVTKIIYVGMRCK